MLKQLSQPSFVNGFARSRGESVRPDLWNGLILGHVPSLGIQGDSLIDCIGGKPRATVVGGTWSSGGLTFNGSSDYLDLGNAPYLDVAAKTIIIDVTPVSLTNYVRLLAAQSEFTNDYAIIHNTSGAMVVTTGDTNTSAMITGAGCLVAGQRAVYTITYASSSRSDITVYKNSIPQSLSTRGSSWIVSSGTFNLMRRQADANYFNATLHTFMFYDRVLPYSTILSLTADPLLPLRRKKIWSMYVPTSTPAAFKPYWYRNKNILIGA